MRFQEIVFQTVAQSFTFLEKQKSFIPKKKINLGQILYTGQESSKRWRFAVPIFQKGFDTAIGFSRLTFFQNFRLDRKI